MAQLDSKQLHDLADNLSAMAEAIGDYRYKNPNIPDEQDQEINDLQSSILKDANELYTLSAIIIIDDEDIQNSLSTITDITTQIKGTYAKLQTIQKAIDVAASIVAFGAALFSKDPKAVADTINDLVNIWNKPEPHKS